MRFSRCVFTPGTILLILLSSTAAASLKKYSTVGECLAEMEQGIPRASYDLARLTPTPKNDIQALFNSARGNAAEAALLRITSRESFTTLCQVSKSGNWNVTEHLLIRGSAFPILVPFKWKTQKRWLATRILAKIGDESVIPCLKDRLDDRMQDIAQEAATGLARIQKEQALPALMRRSRGKNGFAITEQGLNMIGCPALKALLTLPPKQPIPSISGFADNGCRGTLLENMADRPNHIRAQALRALGNLPPGEDIIQRLEEVLTGSDWELKMAAADALGKLKSKTATPALLRGLRNSNPDVLRYIVRALGETGDSRALDPIMDLVRHPGNGTPATEIIDAVTKIAGNSATKYLAEIYHAIRDGTAFAEPSEIASRLGNIHSPETIPLLIDMIQNSPDPMGGLVKCRVMESLAKQHAVSAIPEIQKIATGNAPAHVKLHALIALGELGGEIASDTLLPALEKSKNSRGYVDKTIALAIGKTGDKRAIPLLHEALAAGQPSATEIAASLALLGDETSTPQIISVFEKSGWSGHAFLNHDWAIVEALQRLTPPKDCAIAHRITAADGVPPIIRLTTGDTAARCGSADALSLAREAINDRTTYFAPREILAALRILASSGSAKDTAAISAYLTENRIPKSDQIFQPAQEAIKRIRQTNRE